MHWRYLPNIITIFRFLMIAPFLWALIQGHYHSALWIFVVASISDALDGYLARRFTWQSQWGAYADPLADKLLVVTTYITLALSHYLPLWFVALMVIRDTIIVLGAFTWFWLFKSIEVRPTLISKINTIFQLVLIIAILIHLSVSKLPFYFVHYLIALTALTTAGSFLDYVVCWSMKAIRKYSRAS